MLYTTHKNRVAIGKMKFYLAILQTEVTS